jgi:cytochrome c oxidase subunit IV
MNSVNQPVKRYIAVWAALMLLLLLTWVVASFDLGPANTALALFIAGIKMLLVMLIFMQVRWHSRSVWIFAAAGFFWFLILVTLTLSDYLTRHEVKSLF